ncbi:MAG: YicC/YloC family endoribonuclease [Planctomycetota bacterium]
MALLSMTGFGEVRDERGGYAIVVEVRTVNSRYFKLHLRTTDGYGALESRAESVIREFVKRGTVHCNVRIQQVGTADDFRINKSLLAQYLDQFQELAKERGMDLNTKLEFGSLAALPGVVEGVSSESIDSGEIWAIVEPTIRAALEQLTTMRADEGAALAKDLQQQCQTVNKALAVIEQRVPNVVEHYRRRIADRVNEALESLNVSVEPADLVREISLFAERSDISEEIVRLHSHLEQFSNAMLLPESAGRKLEFICQEMGRETNTIGSKANDSEISQQVVEIKSALERIREQIQNVQ